MLGKLLKYEIKSTARLLVPMYIALLLFGVINRLLNPFKILDVSNSFNLQTLLSFFSIVLYFGLIVGILIMTFVIMIQRYYKNLLGDEGYLMFTLPVGTWKHVVSKLLVSMLWLILSFITVVCSILILANIDNLSGEILNVINQARTYMGSGGLVIIGIYPLIAMIYSIITIYDSISIGHLFSKHKLLASFGAYIVLYFINQIVMSVFMLLFLAINPNIFTNAASPSPSLIISFSIFMLSVVVLMAAANFIITNFILKKKLNLE